MGWNLLSDIVLFLAAVFGGWMAYVGALAFLGEGLVVFSEGRWKAALPFLR
jgi:hypothetical protein